MEKGKDYKNKNMYEEKYIMFFIIFKHPTNIEDTDRMFFIIYKFFYKSNFFIL